MPPPKPPSAHGRGPTALQQDATDLSGRVLHRRWRVVRPIGRGAMSDVYLAEPVAGDGRRYALKVLRAHLVHQPGFGKRFRDEAQVLARLDHPAIVRVHDGFEEDGLVCMVLDFVEGRSLADRLQAVRPLPLDEALPIIDTVLDALDGAHRAGVIHRDVKPSNVLLDHAGRARLCDFGIARQFGQRGVTAFGMTLGTPHYMSPEQVQTPQSIDHRADLYSAGVLLYEMLTGAVPFGNDDAQSDFQILADQVKAEPPDPRQFNPELAPAFADVLRKALRKDPDKRFQGGREFRDALERARQMATSGRRIVPDDERTARSPSPPSSPSPTPPPPRPPRGSRRYTVYAHPVLGRAATKVGPCWPALVLGPFWMLAKGLVPQGLLWLAGEALLLGLMAAVGFGAPPGGPERLLVRLLAAIFVAVWLLPVVFGNRWRGDALLRRGYAAVADTQAADEQAAIAQA